MVNSPVVRAESLRFKRSGVFGVVSVFLQPFRLRYTMWLCLLNGIMVKFDYGHFLVSRVWVCPVQSSCTVYRFTLSVSIINNGNGLRVIHINYASVMLFS